jgi:Ca2+-binding RTX toxin-like protein
MVATNVDMTTEYPVQANQWVTNPANCHTYFLTDPELGTSWTDAEAQAVAAGGHLVTINDATEQQWLIDTFGTSESFWIGLNDAETENQFEWISGEPVTYTNWASGEPNNLSDEDYAELNPAFAAGQWNDRDVFASEIGGRGIVEISNGIIGTPNDDRLRGTDDDDQMFGCSGDDRMRGRDGNDKMFGCSGDDRMRGDDGNDTLIGGLGDDVLFGNDGSDTFVLAAGEGTDVIRDFELSEGDQIGLAGGLEFSQLSFESDQILFGNEILAEVRGLDTSSLTSSNFVLI